MCNHDLIICGTSTGEAETSSGSTSGNNVLSASWSNHTTEDTAFENFHIMSDYVHGKLWTPGR